MREEVKASNCAMEGADQNVTLSSERNMSSPTEIDFRKKCQLNDSAEKMSLLSNFFFEASLEQSVGVIK